MSINETRDPNLVPYERNHWQDWANLVLAIWLFVSPWVLNFGGAILMSNGGGGPVGSAPMAATWNACIVAVIVAVMAVAAISRLQQWEEAINMLLGIWLFVAPWVLGFTGLREAAWDHWIVGALVFVLAIWDLQTVPRMTATTRASYR